MQKTPDHAPIPEILAERDGRVGRLRLRRDRALNALDLPMIRAMHATLDAWAKDPAIEAVVVQGEGRAFCAGGDVRWVRAEVLSGEASTADQFFAEEYALNGAIGHFPKPYIALIDGICMGGGLGISVHGSDRVVTEAALLAMPETGIGLTPDVGASYFLPRLAGFLGTYLGLTGARLAGGDAVHAGLATAFVPRTRLAALSTALAEEGKAAIARFAETPPPFSLGPQRAAIADVFSAESLPAIMARLAAHSSDWARETSEILGRMSPSALCWTFASLRAGAARDLDACLAAELALVRQIIRLPDFAEGVRAMVVEKDRSPRWQPARLEEVDPAAIAALLRA